VLDVGCGFGDSTIRIAQQVSPDGEAVGVDCAENFIRSSVSDAAAAGVRNARFGTMFFVPPLPALRNLRRALEPGGSFTEIAW
jgi:predicted O-methyltransferase YrrM